MNPFATFTEARLREVGIAAALGAAAVYLFIGLGFLAIGTSASGAAPDLLSFGLTMAITYAVVAALLLRFRSRMVWIAVAAVQVIVIVGYFGLSSIRMPPVELWGLVIKACQAVVLISALSLVMRNRRGAVR